MLVGAARFELATSWSRTRRATELRYTPFLIKRIRRKAHPAQKRIGANAGTRTLDLRITNALLYQLSYIGLHSYLL